MPSYLRAYKRLSRHASSKLQPQPAKVETPCIVVGDRACKRRERPAYRCGTAQVLHLLRHVTMMIAKIAPGGVVVNTVSIKAAGPFPDPELDFAPVRSIRPGPIVYQLRVPV